MSKAFDSHGRKAKATLERCIEMLCLVVDEDLIDDVTDIVRAAVAAEKKVSRLEALREAAQLADSFTPASLEGESVGDKIRALGKIRK
jgi:hypothetical protein